jgi:thioesterase domain-containing protein
MFVLPTLGAVDEGITWRIESMARRHIAELRKVQPRGPYRLAGFCVGGIIAFEMARQLQGAGETVERLIVVDSSATNARLSFARPLLPLVPGRTARSRLERQASLMKRLRRYDVRLRQVARLDVAQQIQWMRRNVARRWRRLLEWFGARRDASPPAGPDDARLVEASVLTDAAGGNVLQSQAQAASAYIPRRADLTIDLIWAEGRPNVQRADPTHGWWRVANRVRTHQIVAHHLGLITNDLPKMARVFREILEREEP